MPKKKTEKVVIHEFDPQIYPRLLWVAITTSNTFEKLGKVEDFVDSALAQTEAANDKFKKRGGILIRFKSKKKMNADTIAHEATHAALMICDYIGAEVDIENQEFFAYLVGWISDCCEKVKNYKK